ncbi:hypothetical protein [Paenibacillus macerans]|uniref:hypothetical protein n=1 Tax=Paenibacillus macerans TaxID=44252 RepID=UPI00203DFEFE|nr:hypothetical protein [Paenibacillus macerans]MCM3698026.1 hypothetical protein [Paenibacillus macerans]
MEINAGTELQPFTSRYNSEQACMEALIAMKWLNGFVCTVRQKLPRMCVAIPAIPYRRLIARQPNQPLAAAA